MLVLTRLLAIVALVIVQTAVSHGETVAHILDVKGNVTVTNDGKVRRAEVFGQIAVGETVTFAPTTSLVLAWRTDKPADNRVERFTNGDKVARVAMGPDKLLITSDLKMQPIQRKLEPNALEGLHYLKRGGSGAVAVARSGREPSPPRIEPISGSTVLSTKPLFVWPAAANANTYKFTLRHRANMICTAETKSTKLPLPETLKPDNATELKRGTKYTWDVNGVDIKLNGTEDPEFHVASKGEADEAKKLNELQESLQKKDPDYVPVLVLIASRYEGLRLFSEAIQVYERLAERSPETAAFHAALFELYSRAGRLDDAKKSRDAAGRLGFEFEDEKQADKLMDDFNLRLDKHVVVAESDAAELIATVYELPASFARKFRCQSLYAQAVWSPAALLALQQHGGESQLLQTLDRNQQLLKKKGVPAEVSAIGQLYLANYYYNAQQSSELHEILSADSLLKSMASETVSPGFRGGYWNLRGLVATDDANFASAWDCHNKALALRRATNSAPDEAESLLNLGYLLLQLGDYDSAKKVLENVVAYYAANRTNSTVISGQDVNAELNLTKAQELNRDYDQSIKQLSQLLKQIRQSPDDAERTRLECHVHNNLAVALYCAGQFRACGAALKACQSLAPRAFNASDVHLAEIDANLGWHAWSTNNPKVARSNFELALNRLRKNQPDHYRIPEFMGYLARSVAAGDHAAAVGLLEEALIRRERRLHDALSSALSERDRLAYIQQLRVHPESLAWPGAFDTYLELAPTIGVSVADQYRHVLEWKGALTSFGTKGAAEDTSDERRQLESQYGDVRRRLLVLNQEPGDDPQRNDEVSRLEQRANNLERDIRNLHQSHSDTTPPLALASIAAALPPDAALIDIVEYRRYQDRKEGVSVTDDRIYLAFIVRPDGSVSRFEIGPSAEIDDEVEQFTKNISNRDSVDGQRLNELFARRLRQELGNADLLIISADGGLHRLPWCALPGLKHDYWLDEVTVTNVASAKSFVIRQKESSAPANCKWLAVGDVGYGIGSRFPTLPNTRQEVDQVAKILRNHLPQRPLNVAGADSIAQILVGSDATKANVLKLLPECRIAHIATHGDFLERNADAFGTQARTSGLDSALAFAHANDDPTGGADSLLTAEELGCIDLSHLDLVVLSACDTGLGHIRAGQGLIGLSGALDQANVRSVVSAIWKVDDRATASLMEKFYEQLFQKNGHLAPAKALRNAQLSIRQQPDNLSAHPYFWAAWSVNGSPGG